MNIIEYLSNIPGRNFEIHYCYIAGKQGLFYILLIDHFIEINLTLVRLILSDFYYRIKAAFNVEPSVGGFWKATWEVIQTYYITTLNVTQ